MIKCPSCGLKSNSYSYSSKFLINKMGNSWYSYICPKCGNSLKEVGLFRCFFDVFIYAYLLIGLNFLSSNLYLTGVISVIILSIYRCFFIRFRVIDKLKGYKIKESIIEPQRFFPPLFFNYNSLFSSIFIVLLILFNVLIGLDSKFLLDDSIRFICYSVVVVNLGLVFLIEIFSNNK